jgi:hypothetical protein
VDDPALRQPKASDKRDVLEGHLLTLALQLEVARTGRLEPTTADRCRRSLAL